MLGDQGRGRWVVRVALGSQSQRFGCWGDADRPRIGSVRKAATCLMQKSVLIKMTENVRDESQLNLGMFTC